MSKKRTFSTASIALIGLTMLVGAVVPLHWNGPVRVGALVGVVTASIGSILAFVIICLTIDQEMKKMLIGLVSSVLCRMLLVAGGLLLAVVLRADPMAFCFAFFTLYFVHQVIEILSVTRQRRRTIPLLSEGKT